MHCPSVHRSYLLFFFFSEAIAVISKANEAIKVPTLVINSDTSVMAYPRFEFMEEALTIPPSLARGFCCVGLFGKFGRRSGLVGGVFR
jgi:hypothetical protein